MTHASKALLASITALAAATLLTNAAQATPEEHTYTFHTNYWGAKQTNGRREYVGQTSGGKTLTAEVSAWRIENIPVSSGDIYGKTSSSTNTEISEFIYSYGSSGLGIDQYDALYIRSSGTSTSDENAPWHGVDNNPDNCSASSGWCDDTNRARTSYTGEEFFVFEFEEEVSLHGFEFGYAREQAGRHEWCGSDYLCNRADATVLQGTGNNDYSLSALTNNAVNSAAGGFELVGNYEDVGSGSKQTVESGSYSRYWAVSTLLASILSNPHDYDNLYEGAKLSKLVVKTRKPGDPPPGVPLPGTLALFGAGLILLRQRGNKNHA